MTDQPRDARQDLLDAIDYPYAYGVLGYETREALIDAFTQQLDSELLAERDRLRATLTDVLAEFIHRTHPGEPCLQTGHVAVRTVERWRAALSTPSPVCTCGHPHGSADPVGHAATCAVHAPQQ